MSGVPGAVAAARSTACCWKCGTRDVVPIIGLDWKDKADEALSLLQQLGNPYEVVAVDKDGREAIEWGVYGAPETFLVNDQGIVVYKYIGPLTHEAWEKEFLPRLPPKQGAARAQEAAKS